MARRSLQALLLLVLAGIWHPAIGQEAGDDFSAAPVIEITGQASTLLLRYDRAIAGMDAYERGIATAPASRLTFRLIKNDPAVKTQGVQVELAGRHTKMPLALSSTGQLTLPRDARLLDEQAEIMVNRRKSALFIQPSVRTGGLPKDSYRLGDLRLQCQVSLAMHEAGMSLMARLLGRNDGVGCNYMVFREAPGSVRRFAGFELRDGGRLVRNSEAQIDTAANNIKVPLKDLGWPDDTLVAVQFK